MTTKPNCQNLTLEEIRALVTGVVESVCLNCEGLWFEYTLGSVGSLTSPCDSSSRPGCVSIWCLTDEDGKTYKVGGLGVKSL